MNKIDLKYKIPLVGKYNARISTCPECNERLLGEYRYGSVYKHIIGFADSSIGKVSVVECPNCFTKWYFHTDIDSFSLGVYDYFLEYLKDNKNKHFKYNGNKHFK